MANEFRLNFTGSEINRKLEVIDELQGVLEHNYYTSDEIDTKIDEVSTDINVKFGAAGSSLEAGLATKADLVGGKVPVAQLPDDLVDLSNYYTKSDVDNEIIIVNADTDAKLATKADLVEGKVPLEQLPDNIGDNSDLSDYYTKEEIDSTLSEKADLVDGKIPAEQLPDNIGSGGGIPADHTHDVEDIEGLLVEETYQALDTIWEYSDEITVDQIAEIDGVMQYFYRISDDIQPNGFIGMTITTTDGTSGKITSDLIESSSGIYHAISLPNIGVTLILIFQEDFDLSMMGLTGVIPAGSYAARYLIDGNTIGLSKIQTEVEATKLSISNELLPSALQIGETGTIIEWDGTPTDTCIDAMDTLYVKMYKVGESMSKEEMIGSTITMTYGDVAIIDASMIIDMGEIGYMIMDTNKGEVFASVSFKSGAFDLSMFAPGLIIECPSAGLWFLWASDSEYTKSLTGTDYKLKQLDPKYIPANLDFNLSDYYTKAEIDSMLGDYDIILNEISALIGE